MWQGSWGGVLLVIFVHVPRKGQARMEATELTFLYGGSTQRLRQTWKLIAVLLEAQECAYV